MELTGLAMPENQAGDGVSLAPLLRGETEAKIADRDLFRHYPHYGNQGGDPASVIRSGDWKLIDYHEDGHDELCNFAKDIGEQNDLSSEKPEMKASLRKRLDQWLDDVGAKMPVPDPEYDAEREKAYLEDKKTRLMRELEAQHAEYLDPDWEPNPDWWGSWIVRD